MKKILLMMLTICSINLVPAQSKFEITINTIGTWMGTYDDGLKNLMKKGEYNHIFFEFHDNGTLTVTRYQGEMTNLKKIVETYQYHFDKETLTVTANGNTQKIVYSLEYHSFRERKSMTLYYWKGSDKELHLSGGETAFQAKKDFDDL